MGRPLLKPSNPGPSVCAASCRPGSLLPLRAPMALCRSPAQAEANLQAMIRKAIAEGRPMEEWTA